MPFLGLRSRREAGAPDNGNGHNGNHGGSRGPLALEGHKGFDDPNRVVTLADLDKLMSRAFEMRRGEVVADGFASIRQAMGQSQSDLSTRMGVMTSKKVCEVHKLLVEEM